MNLVTRVHEWLADHVSWVQYPHVRASRKTMHEPANGLPLEARFALFCFGIIGVVVGTAGTIVGGLALIYLLKAIFA